MPDFELPLAAGSPLSHTHSELPSPTPAFQPPPGTQLQPIETRSHLTHRRRDHPSRHGSVITPTVTSAVTPPHASSRHTYTPLRRRLVARAGEKSRTCGPRQAKVGDSWGTDGDGDGGGGSGGGVTAGDGVTL